MEEWAASTRSDLEGLRELRAFVGGAALGEMWKHLALIGPHDRLPSRPPSQVLMLTNSF